MPTANGRADPGRKRHRGPCASICYDEGGQGIAQTTTDSNGYYGFHAPPGTYWVEFVRPEHLAFVAAAHGRLPCSTAMPSPRSAEFR